MLAGPATASAYAANQAPAQTAAPASGKAPIRVAIVGLVHGHVQGWFYQLAAHPEVQLVGVADPDASLRERYATRYHLPASMFFTSESEMLAHVHPQAVLVYTSIAGHRDAIVQAARLHIASMVEKPLSTTLPDALAIQEASREFHVPVLVNYETTWYASNTAAAHMLWGGQIGDLRKLVVHDGHRGPKEIGVGPEFLNWLTDPKENGAGALFDFGCYGVDLATWLMHGEAPLTVTAVTQQIKPDVYPKVEDEGTIILTYPHMQAIIQGSWNWPFDRKDMELYGANGYVDTVALDGLRVRLPGEKAEHAEAAPALVDPQDNSLHYLAAVLGGQVQPQGDLSSLDTNVTVMRILDAARTSAKTGKTVSLAGGAAR
ncbi:gfo/Idh/MocA family oxidoreductase [Acidipila sp. EB88]|nr:gfo/Idh/MocA family oxidoreductase [Acidipila sp. EB88]